MKVFDYTKPPYNGTRALNGQTITFRKDDGTSQSVLVKGSGKPTQVIPIRVDQTLDVTPDLVINGLGQSVSMKLTKFRNAPTGSAANVSISGVTFTVTLSDGSVNVVTAP